MHSFKDKKSFPYTGEFIKNIILDIEKYPEFLPWCNKADIISKSENEMIGELTINFKGFSEKYRSCIVTSENDQFITIKVEAISGPFKKLINIWRIEKLNNYCIVNFSIDFEFKSMILNVIVGSFFSIATDKMINAFEARAVYLSKV